MPKRVFSDRLEFIIAGLTYIAANVADYLFTVSGIQTTAVREGNPVIQSYINVFGLENGLMLSKLLICGVVIMGAMVISSAYRMNRCRLKAEPILYGGAVLTALGGSLWLCF